MLSRILRQLAKGSGGTLPTVDDAAQARASVTPEGEQAALPSSTATPAATSPRRIAQFVLLEQLGAGGMGLVFAAFDEHLERKVAIKLVRPQAPDRGSAAQERLLREAQALARLSHPNVVAVHEAGVLPDGDVFIAMEFIKGVSLRQWQRASGRSWREILSAYVAAATGLSAAHHAGIVHRDFKPDNVLVGQDGRVRVVDFGLALAKSPEADDAPGDPSGQTASSSAAGVAGTPGYIPPEQLNGGGADARGDQFSFCVSLYEALYGERPFADLAFVRAGSDPSAAPRRSRPADSHARWLWEALDRGLAIRPEERFPDMEALIAALTRDHGRTRRRVLAASAIMALVAVTSAATLRLQDSRSLCAASSTELAGTWDEMAKQRVRAALLGTRLPYAMDVWAATEARLDRYAGRWLNARQQACEDTHVRHVQSSELLDRRMECLAARRRSLAATVEVFAIRPAQAAERSDALLDGLGDLAVCADAGVLRLGLPPPREAQAVTRLEELRGHLTRAEALLAAGDLAGSEAELGTATQLDASLSYPPAHAEVLRLQGRLALQQGRPVEGKALLHDALVAATEARHDELVADVWLALASTGATHQPIDEAKEWVRQADAWLRRLGHDEDGRRIEVERARGVIQKADGQSREAAQTFTRALEDAQARHVDEVRLVPLLRGRAIAYAALGEASLAQADYQRAIELGLAAWGPSHPEVAATRRALGVLKIERLGQIAEGRRELEQAEAIFRAAQGEDSPDVADCVQALAQADKFSGDYASALRHTERADAIFEHRLGANHRRRGETQLAIGVLRFMLKDYPGSLAAYERARAILEASIGAEHVDVGILLSNIGETLLALGENEAAIQRFEQALAILRRGLGPSHADLAYPLKGLGQAQLATNHPGLARAPLEEALTLTERASGGDPQELAEIRWALARTLARIGVEPVRRQQLAAAALGTYKTLGPEWTGRVREVARFLEQP